MCCFLIIRYKKGLSYFEFVSVIVLPFLHQSRTLWWEWILRSPPEWPLRRKWNQHMTKTPRIPKDLRPIAPWRLRIVKPFVWDFLWLQALRQPPKTLAHQITNSSLIHSLLNANKYSGCLLVNGRLFTVFHNFSLLFNTMIVIMQMLITCCAAKKKTKNLLISMQFSFHCEKKYRVSG